MTTQACGRGVLREAHPDPPLIRKQGRHILSYHSQIPDRSVACSRRLRRQLPLVSIRTPACKHRASSHLPFNHVRARQRLEGSLRSA